MNPGFALSPHCRMQSPCKNVSVHSPHNAAPVSPPRSPQKAVSKQQAVPPHLALHHPQTWAHSFGRKCICFETYASRRAASTHVMMCCTSGLENPAVETPWHIYMPGCSTHTLTRTRFLTWLFPRCKSRAAVFKLFLHIPHHIVLKPGHTITSGPHTRQTLNNAGCCTDSLPC